MKRINLSYIATGCLLTIAIIKETARKCKSCGKTLTIFKKKYRCEICGNVYCAVCITFFDNYIYYASKKPTTNYKNNYLCDSCWDINIKGFHNKYMNALSGYEKIRAYPINYEGDIKANANNQIVVKSGYYKKKAAAMKELKVTALIEGYDVVYGVEQNEDTYSEPSHNGKGTHHYTAVQLVGKAAKYKISK